MPANTQQVIQAPVQAPAPRLAPGTRVENVGRVASPAGTVPPESRRGSVNNLFIATLDSAAGSVAGDLQTAALADWAAKTVGFSTGTTAAAQRADVLVNKPALYKNDSGAKESGRATVLSNAAFGYGACFSNLQLEGAVADTIKTAIVQECYMELTGEISVLREFSLASSNCYFNEKTMALDLSDMPLYVNGRAFIRISYNAYSGAASANDKITVRATRFVNGQHLQTVALQAQPVVPIEKGC